MKKFILLLTLFTSVLGLTFSSVQQADAGLATDALGVNTSSANTATSKK